MWREAQLDVRLLVTSGVRLPTRVHVEALAARVRRQMCFHFCGTIT
jgi:hypothetical protein